MIQLLGITKQFGCNKNVISEVFCDADFEIEKNVSVAIKGRSGSGKSTLLSILAGLDINYTGNYYFNGNMIEKKREVLAEHRLNHIGIITQSYQLLSDRNCYDNVAFPLQCLKYKKRIIRKRVEEVMTLLDVLKYKNRHPHELSGGQCQRVAIARAMVKAPEILLADEPTGAMDETSEKEILKILDILIENGQTLVVATHSDLVAQHCARTYEISNCKIKQIK